MALTSNPRTASLLVIFLAGLIGYIGYTGEVLNLAGVSGLRARVERVQLLEDSLRRVQGAVDSARRELARGSVEEVRQRTEQYRTVLALLRQFVPEQNEVPNLLDDINTRAKIRGVSVAVFNPQPVVAGPAPFDTYGYEMAVIGRYDQIGRFLTDVAGLRRIIVPVGVRLAAADQARFRALGDTTRSLLEARFQVQTFVKAPGGTDGQE
jgi:Tfp pilus assembly protein PilO